MADFPIWASPPHKASKGLACVCAFAVIVLLGLGSWAGLAWIGQSFIPLLLQLGQ